MKLKVNPKFIKDLNDPSKILRGFYYDLTESKIVVNQQTILMPEFITDENDTSLLIRNPLTGDSLRLTYDLLSGGNNFAEYVKLLNYYNISSVQASARYLYYGNRRSELNSPASTELKLMNIACDRSSDTLFRFNLISPVDINLTKEINLQGDNSEARDTLYILYTEVTDIDTNEPSQIPEIAMVIYAGELSVTDSSHLNKNISHLLELNLSTVLDGIKATFILNNIADGISKMHNESAHVINNLKNSEVPVIMQKHFVMNNFNDSVSVPVPTSEEIHPNSTNPNFVVYGTKYNKDYVASDAESTGNGIPQSISDILYTYRRAITDTVGYNRYPLHYNKGIIKVSSNENRLLIDEENDFSSTIISDYYINENQEVDKNLYIKLSSTDIIARNRGLEEIYFMNRNAIRLLGKVLTTYTGDSLENRIKSPIYSDEGHEVPVSESQLNALFIDAPTDPSTRELFSVNLADITHYTRRQVTETDLNKFVKQGQYYLDITDSWSNVPIIPENFRYPLDNNEMKGNAYIGKAILNVFAHQRHKESSNEEYFNNGAMQVLTLLSIEGNHNTSVYVRSFIFDNNNNNYKWTNWDRVSLNYDEDTFALNESEKLMPGKVNGEDDIVLKSNVSKYRSVQNAVRLRGAEPTAQNIANTVMYRDSNNKTMVDTITTINTFSTDITNSNLVTTNSMYVNASTNTDTLNVRQTSIFSNTVTINADLNINNNSIKANTINVNNVTLDNTLNINGVSTYNLNAYVNSSFMLKENGSTNKFKITTYTPNGQDDKVVVGVDNTNDKYYAYLYGKDGIKLQSSFIVTSEGLTGIDGPTIKDVSEINCTGELKAQKVTTTSLRSEKENISKYEDNAIDLINSINVVNFNYIKDKSKTRHVGFIADDTDELLSDNHTSMDHQNCIGVLIKAVQELDKKINK